MNINELHLQELRRFAELGRLSASMIHEISNPLTAALLQLELSDTSPAVRKARYNMRTLLRYVEAARQQISSASRLKHFSISVQFRELKRILRPLAKQAGVTLAFKLPATSCRLYGDPVKFHRIISNLVMNAIQAYGEAETTDEARVVVSVSDTPGWLVVQVRDWGKGIASSEIPKLFEPFYSTKDGPRRGLGIGLATVRQAVVEDFNGSIKVSSSRRLGTCFTVRLRHSNDWL